MSNTKVKQEGWREVKLREIADVVMGQSPKSDTYNEEGIGLPFYQGVVDFGYKFITPRVYCSNPKKTVEAEDILLSVRAPVGRVNFTKEKCSIGRGNAGLRHKKGEQDFLFYMLKFLENKLNKASSGSVFASVSKNDINFTKFLCPPLPEQKAIAEVLSSLDDKIDLLHRQNKTLEDMAQTLFRHWFVENSPPVEGWQSERTDGVVSPLERYQAEPDEVVPQRSTKDYLSLPYNPKLKKRASELRKAGNLCEVLLWEQMKSGKLKGLDFDRQKIIGNYIVDFYCASLGLVIEIDGISHDDKEKYDSERDVFLERLGLTVIHIADKDVREDLAGVMEFLSGCVACEGEERPPRQASPATPPQEGNYPASGLPRQGRGMGKIGEGWRKVKLGDLVICSNGVSYRSADLNPSDMALVTLKNFDREGGFKLNGFKEYTGKYKEQHIVNQGDLIVAHTDITQNAEVVGNPALVIADPKYKLLAISMDAVKVQPTEDWLTKEFLYFLMRTRNFKEHCLGLANGSTVLHLSRNAVPSFEFTLPPIDTINQFALLAKEVISKIFENISQIRTLKTLRETLLPKLMSGEVTVEKLKCKERTL